MRTASAIVIRPFTEAVVATLLMLAVSCSGVGFVWKQARDAQYESIRTELLNLANTAAVQVDGELHHQLRSPQQQGSAEHLRLLAPLVRFHRANPDLIYVYTAIMQDGGIHFVGGTDYVYDAPYDDMKDQPADPIMTEYQGRDADFRTALEQQTAVVNQYPVPSRVRSYLSAYAPIYRADGSFEGVVGIDMWSHHLNARLERIRDTALLGMAGVTLLSVLAGIVLYRVRRRAAAAEQALHGATAEAVTARLEAEQLARELDNHAAHLEQLVEQRTAERIVSEARFRALVDQSVIGVFIADARGINYVNPGLAALLGHEDPASALQAPEISVLAADATGTLPCSSVDGVRVRIVDVQHRDGTPMRLEIHRQEIPSDARAECIGVVMDVTTREQAAAARAESLAAVELLSRLKTQFIDNVRHELRTPLSSIIGLAQLGERSQDLSRAQHLFSRALGEGRQLLGMIDQMLDFSGFDKGALDIRPTAANLGALLDASAEEAAAIAAAKGLAFAQVRGSDLPATAVLDVARVQQILKILLANAVKFTDEGHVELALARADGDLCFSVSDTGQGIAPEYAQRLFTPFEQQDGTLSRRFSGIGLGLALARILAHRMGGTLGVSSTPGVGSRFEFRLPLKG